VNNTCCASPGQVWARQVTAALWLVGISVGFGLLSGTVSVITGLDGDSLSVLAIGLGVLAGMTGAAALIWRFADERRQLGRSPAAEDRAALVAARRPAPLPAP
jgi:hypothetical protein